MKSDGVTHFCVEFSQQVFMRIALTKPSLEAGEANPSLRLEYGRGLLRKEEINHKAHPVIELAVRCFDKVLVAEGEAYRLLAKMGDLGYDE